MKSLPCDNALGAENINLHHADFCIDTLDLFQRRRAGHMSKWLYSTPKFSGDKACGADVREHVIEEAKNGSPYYVFLDEQAIIQKSLPALQSILKKPSRLIDLGPGSLDAVEDKIFPVLDDNSQHIVQYVSVDVCIKTLDDAAEAVKRKYLSIETAGINHNFIEDKFTYGRPLPLDVAMLFGLTMFNIEIDPHETGWPEAMLQNYLGQLKKHFSSDDKYLVMTQDINHDIESLRAAYFAISPYFMCLPHLMQRDLFIEGNFNPDGFGVDIEYFSETKALSACFVANEDMAFSIEDEACRIKAGERFYFNNAYKFDIATFVKAANANGMRLIETIQEDGNHCVLHIMQVA